jgi:DNA processing protein
MTPRQTADWMALSLLPGLGPTSLNRLLERFPDPHEIAFNLPAHILSAGNRGARAAAIHAARRNLRRKVDEELRRVRKAGVRILTRDSEDYPAALLEIPAAPILLYMRGTLAPGRPRVAVVGSRSATRYGRRIAEETGAGLAQRGFEVVSGGARGIDTCAHRGALGAGGVTIAVLGSGLLEPYPPENYELFEEILETGALLSEFPMTCPPSTATFPQRNRLVSGLSAAVVVVEAAAKSGALITARHALEQGREVLAVPGPATSGRSAGANRLIQQGAKLVQEIDDIVAELPPLYRQVLPAGGDLPEIPGKGPDLEGLTKDEMQILGMLDPVEPVHADDLALAAPFDVARLQVALFGLQLRGAVDLEPGRYYLLRPRREP